METSRAERESSTGVTFEGSNRIQSTFLSYTFFFAALACTFEGSCLL